MTLKEQLAREFYKRTVVSDQWDKEQDHLKFQHLDAAQDILDIIDRLGYQVVEKPKVEEVMEESAKVETAELQEPEEPPAKPKKHKSGFKRQDWTE